MSSAPARAGPPAIRARDRHDPRAADAPNPRARTSLVPSDHGRRRAIDPRPSGSS